MPIIWHRKGGNAGTGSKQTPRPKSVALRSDECDDGHRRADSWEAFQGPARLSRRASSCPWSFARRGPSSRGPAIAARLRRAKRVEAAAAPVEADEEQAQTD